MEDEVTASPEAPPVIFWFKIYCAFLCLLYLLVAALGVFFFFMNPEHFEGSAFLTTTLAIVYLLLGVGLFGACLLPLVLSPRPWLWTYDLVIIALGISSPCLLPASIPLLIFWVKPETRIYFGKT